MWHAINESLSDLCSSVLWDTNLTWNTVDPEFTECFERTILVWLPCAVLWLTLPLSIYSFRTTKTSAIPFNRYNLCKLVTIVILATSNLVDILNYVFVDRGEVLVYTYTLVAKFFTICVFFGLTYSSLKCGVVSSGNLFLYSLLLVFCGAPQFRTELRSKGSVFKFGSEDWNEKERNEIVEFLPYFIYYLACWVTLLLNCFADTRPPLGDGAHVCPENGASVLSRAIFFWFDSFAWKGYRHMFVEDDVWNVDDELKTARVTSRFESKLNLAFMRLNKNGKFRYGNGKAALKLERCSAFAVTNPSEGVSIFRPLIETFGSSILLSLLVLVFAWLLQLVKPLLLSLILDFVDNKKEAPWHGYVYATIFLMLSILQCVSFTLFMNMIVRTGLMMRAALVSVIYKKALRISNGTRTKFTVGEILNLMSVDTQRFLGILFPVLNMCYAPLGIFLTLFGLWRILGLSVLAGGAVLVSFIPLNYLIASKIQKQQSQQMAYKDERVKFTTEILSGIKVLKLNAWEPSMEKQVANIRRKEIAVLRKTLYFESGSSFLWALAPFLVSFVTFAIYVLSSDQNVLTAQVAFVSLSLFNLLRHPLSLIPSSITNITQIAVSMRRISEFLNSEDIDVNAVQHEERPEQIIIENGRFSWESYNGLPVLENINLRVMPGSLVAIVGPVGVGKSSLLSAILGELYKLSGLVNTKGSIAYVPQQAWIRNATFKDNITLEEAPNDSFYSDILAACALNEDLKILPGRDLAEIGEKGVNLSGGQKQRISLARAVYSNADIYLLDDPLSAVDTHVGKHIFEQVIGPNGLLKNKTRVWVTHNLTYLSQVDLVVVLQNGVISESGPYHKLLELNGDFANHLATYMNAAGSKESELEQAMSIPESTDRIVPSEQEDVAVAGKKLIEDEKAEIGTVNWSVYVHFLKAMGPALVAIIPFISVLYQTFSVASNYWLAIWSSDTSEDVEKQYMYLGVYALFGFSEAFSIMIRSLVLYMSMLKAANGIHNRLLISVLHWPAIAFDRIPLGRIINRFSSDVDTLDNILPKSLEEVLRGITLIISTILIICHTFPVFVIVIIPIGAAYYFIQSYYIVTSRQLRRFQSTSKSPIFSHIGESVMGATSIRAYGILAKSTQILYNKIDYNQRSSYASLVGEWCMNVRLELVVSLTTFSLSIFAVLARDRLNAGIVGLVVNYAVDIALRLYPGLMKLSEIRTNVVSIERIKEYEEKDQEAQWHVAGENIPADWPSKGEVVFQDFQTRYRDELEPVLKGISFTIASREKVGVVGRTGAGKSSLTLSLFRFIEPTGGRILVDGVDITKIGLHTLRGRLTIIPQDPVLFSGTLRINLDPSGAHSDDQLWRALKLANLKAFVSNLNLGLESDVTGGGSNFSVGQRQLICLARAVLRKSKLLILDEATAAVDMETDNFIQSTLRKEFKDCTVLTIAHRLNTVLDYDRILVLDSGRIAEFDAPRVLLESKQSIFYQMASDAGLI